MQQSAEGPQVRSHVRESSGAFRSFLPHGPGELGTRSVLPDREWARGPVDDQGQDEDADDAQRC